MRADSYFKELRLGSTNLFNARFPDEKCCIGEFYSRRWRDGYFCVRCKNKKVAGSIRKVIQCSKCRHQKSVISGSIFERSHLPLRKWFIAIWLLTKFSILNNSPKANIRLKDKFKDLTKNGRIYTYEHGFSGNEVQQLLGIRGYKTIWAIMHKLRQFLKTKIEIRKFNGLVVMGEVSFGGKEILVILGGKPTSVSLKYIYRYSSLEKIAIVRDIVEPGSTILTPLVDKYKELINAGYLLEKITENQFISSKASRAMNPLDRWWNISHLRAVETKYIDEYLSEFAFKWNNRGYYKERVLFYYLLDLIAKNSN
ncbi:MAG: hypothetical protein ACKVQC_00980 [Elusimicrobiota bacterium]